MDKILIRKYYYSASSEYDVSDDTNDRLNNRATVCFLVLAILVITTQTYVGKPINCWTPAEFKGTHDTYANSVCWLKGSYYLPTDEITIPDRSKLRLDYVSYYQWTPFILLGMSILFLAPRIFWNNFIRRTGVHVAFINRSVMNEKQRENTISAAKVVLEDYLIAKRTKNNRNIRYTATYFAVKCFYLINSVAQFFLLNLFLSFNFTGYGIEVLNRRLNGEDSFESRRFPRVTMCDFMVRRLGSNQHWYAVQCNLPINLYNELIFLLIWLWLIILSISNMFSIILFICSMINRNRHSNLKRYLSIPIEQEKRCPASQVDNRTTTLHGNLGVDGYLLVRLIAQNTDDIAIGTILQTIDEKRIQ